MKNDIKMHYENQMNAIEAVKVIIGSLFIKLFLHLNLFLHVNFKGNTSRGSNT